MFTKLLILITVLLFTHGCEDNNQYLITEEEFGDQWPFTVEKGLLYAINQSAIFEANGIQYQLNAIPKKQGCKPIDSIWKDDTDIPGTKKSLHLFIKEALKRPK